MNVNLPDSVKAQTHDDIRVDTKLDDGTPMARNVGLRDVVGDDDDEYHAASAALQRGEHHVIGGGAAPSVVVTLAETHMPGGGTTGAGLPGWRR